MYLAISTKLMFKTNWPLITLLTAAMAPEGPKAEPKAPLMAPASPKSWPIKAPIREKKKPTKTPINPISGSCPMMRLVKRLAITLAIKICRISGRKEKSA